VQPAIAVIAPVDQHDKPVPESVATNIVIGILGQTRTVSAGPGSPSGVQTGKSDPLGEMVSVNLELAGLKDQPVLLSWSIFHEGSHTNLFGKWLDGQFVAFRLVATTNDDTATLQMWIPLPKLAGPFFAELSLTTENAGLASAASGPFD
jgi:hypothetical protein